MKLSIVVPVYNEKDNVLPLAERIREAMDQSGTTDWEVVLIDDGSTDGTESYLAQLERHDPQHFRAISFASNQGQTAALDAGFHKARFPFVLTMDADLQNDPYDFPLLREKMAEGIGCVCGVRQQRKDNWLRRFSSKIANGVRNALSNESITDTGCSLKLFRKDCLERLKLFEGLHRFLPTLCKLEGYRVIEVPVSHHPRFAGESKYGVWNRVFKSFFDLLAVRWMKRRYLHYEIKPKKRRNLHEWVA